MMYILSQSLDVCVSLEPFQTELHQLNSCLKSSGALQNQLRCFECQRAET